MCSWLLQVIDLIPRRTQSVVWTSSHDLSIYWADAPPRFGVECVSVDVHARTMFMQEQSPKSNLAGL